jgi:hypothetical protein
MRINGRAPTLEAAKAEFETNWQQWLEGAKGEVPESHGLSFPKTISARSDGAIRTRLAR